MEGLPLIGLASVGIFVNVIWHVLNFSGWLNQNHWFYVASELMRHELDDEIKLPTDSWKRMMVPTGWIYWLAQSVPSGLVVLSLCLLREGLAKYKLFAASDVFVSSATLMILIAAAVAVCLVEYSVIALGYETTGKAV